MNQTAEEHWMEGEPVTAEENRMEGESVRAVENGMEGAPMTGDENANTSWWVEVEKMLAASRSVESARWRKQSIYRVPEWIKDMNSKAYQPQFVSLGPFHHGDSNLPPMEEHKRRALAHRVRRSGKPLLDFFTAVKKEADKLVAAYGNDLGDKWRGENRDRFVEVMVTDGCFLLEILMGDVRNYSQHDPIFSPNGRYYHDPLIRSDMLVMENQLPLLLLHRLEAVGSESSDSDIPRVDEGINRSVLKFMDRPFQDVGINQLQRKLHPLDLYYTCLVGRPRQSRSQIQKKNCWWMLSYCSASKKKDRRSLLDYQHVIMPSAVKMHKSGIKFKKSKTTSLNDIHFEHGVLSMPVVEVEDNTGYLFLNLMAFERLHVTVDTLVMDYVFFMDNIIDSVEDVALLTSKGVVKSFLGSNGEVATLFNGTLSRGALMSNSTKLQELKRNVEAYCQKPCNKWRANLIQKYFRNPWAFISLVAAVILLTATLVQTVFTVMQFKSKP